MTAPPVSHSLENHFNSLLKDIKAGQLIPVVGGDINLCGRPLDENGIPVGWQEQGDELSFPPTTSELVLRLLEKAITESQASHKPDNLPDAMHRLLSDQLEGHYDSIYAVGLANVCQYIHFVDSEILDGFLPDLLSREYRATPVHDFLVQLAQYRPDPRRADTPPYPCIVTTCFDQVLEQQLRKNNVKFHLVAFVLVQNGGVFQYTPPGQVPEEDAKELGDGPIPDLRGYPVVLKLNGGVKPGRRDFAITEDHLIDYLNHQGVKDALPGDLLAKLTKRGRNDSHLLFMGYNLRHWSLRVILRRIWSESLSNQNKRWTVALEKSAGEIDRRFWEDYGLKDRQQLPIGSLEAYIEALSKRVDDLQVTQGQEPPIRDAGYPPPPPVRDGVFFSYSHKDVDCLNEIKRLLNPVRSKIKMWDDRDIAPGAKWRDEIQERLKSAKAAVLLVSPDFLSSPFIEKNELPPLLKAAKDGGCQILWINIKPSMVDYTEISEYQALHKDPALSAASDAQRSEFLKKIAVLIMEAGLATPRPESV